MAAHVFLDRQPRAIQHLAKVGKLTGPLFVGQGVSFRVGSDCYGKYIVYVSPDLKTVGLIDSDSEFVESWTDGNMTSTMPTDAFDQRPENLEWIQEYGNKWYSAYWSTSEHKVIRRKGCHTWPNWNGSFNYRDPSF